MSNDIWSLLLGLGAGLACGFLNTAASSGSAVSLPILLMIGLDPVSANATNRIPVLIGAVAATASFHKRKALLWGLAVKVSLPVAIGAPAGAGLAEILPGRDLALIITAAILVALALLFTKLKQANPRPPKPSGMGSENSWCSWASASGSDSSCWMARPICCWR
jgi:uncharacterized membrane protein YfcA